MFLDKYDSPEVRLALHRCPKSIYHLYFRLLESNSSQLFEAFTKVLQKCQIAPETFLSKEEFSKSSQEVKDRQLLIIH